MNAKILNRYAELIVKVGANVQKNQEVIVSANVEDSYFVKYVVEEAYKAGAKSVSVEWGCDEINRLNLLNQSTKALCEFPQWKEEKLKYQVKTLPAMIHIINENPDALNGVDQSKILARQRAIGPTIMKYREKMDNRYQWTIAGIPGPAWAKKVFPDLPERQAVTKLWDAILTTARVKGHAINNWKNHNANLNEKKNKLNDLGIKKLTYKSENGTDFSIELKKCMVFEAGGAYTIGGVYYNPNMPTEECFTSPDKYSANGVVMATKPLSVRGVLVEDFGFRFENGKVVDVIAKNPDHKDVLEKLVSTDDGARMLGEVALVPFDSPVNQTGLLFYNTLYDENACCHLALGRAFNECIKDFEKLSDEEIEAVDLNKSMIHVDFMIGSDDLDIVAETFDGKIVQIFSNGTWAI